MQNKWKNGILDELITATTPDPNGFNVLNHGDAWTNNIMFTHDENNQPIDSIFIDFQISVYASPALDIHYFLLATAHSYLEKEFDNLILHYHTQLVQSLTKLNYQGNIPTLKNLHINLIETGIVAAFSTMFLLPLFLVDQDDNASIDLLRADGPIGVAFREKAFGNQRYKRALEALLPFYDAKGLLDVNN